MALITKVLLHSMLILSVLGQQQLQEGNIIDLVALRKLLRTAARLAYPITTRLNSYVGNLREVDPLVMNRRTNSNPNKLGRNPLRTDFQNLRRANLPTRNGPDVNRRYSPTPTYYNYDYGYEYDYDEDYMEPVYSFEGDDDFGVLPEPEPKHPNSNGVILLSDLLDEEPNRKLIPPKIGKQRPAHLTNDGRVHSKPLHHQPGFNVPLTNANAPRNVLPGSNDAQPKIIYVVVNPGDVNPGMIKDNTIVLNKQELKAIEDGASNPANGYYIAPNAGPGISNDPVISAVNPNINIKQTATKPKVK